MLKLQKICKKAIALLGVIIFLFLTCYAWRYSIECLGQEYYRPVKDSLPGNAAAAAVVVGAAVLLGKTAKRCKPQILHIVAVFLAVMIPALLCILIQNVDYYNQADQVYVYDGACALYEKNFDIDMWNMYFRVYPYQLRLARLFSYIFGIAGGCSLAAIQNTNALCVGVIIYIGFRITRELFKEPLAELLYLICAVTFLPLEIYTMFIYGELPGTCGAMLTVWCFLIYNRRESPLWMKLLAGAAGMFSFSVAFAARTAMLIVWIALGIIQLLIVIKRKNWLALLLTVSILAAAEVCGSLLITSVEKEYGAELNSGMPMVLSIAMGMQDPSEQGRAPGSYNNYEWSTYTESGMNQEAAEAKAMDYIQGRLQEWLADPTAAVTFYREKILYQWNEPSYNAYAMTNQYKKAPGWLEEFYGGELRDLCNRWLNGYQSVLYLALLALFMTLLFKDQNEEHYLLGLIIIGEFLFSILWEAKGRYVFPYLVMILPCMAGGLCCVVTNLRDLRRLQVFF